MEHNSENYPLALPFLGPLTDSGRRECQTPFMTALLGLTITATYCPLFEVRALLSDDQTVF